MRNHRLWLIFMVISAVFTLASTASATTYYIAANGSDSNNGTSKSTPWAHAPGMATCSATCASVTPQPGDHFVFRGGDTWHFGNSSASPYTSGWTWKWSGTSGNPIYVGVDKTWYSGASWSRPILNGDNPTSTSGVSSCTYDESTSVFLFLNGSTTNATFDNFEFTGLCWHGNQSNSNEHICCAGYINNYYGTPNVATNNTFSNLYMHGWTHVNFSCSLNGGEPTGNCDGAAGITGSSSSPGSLYQAGDKITGLVCDGWDTDKVSFACVFWACYDVDNSVLSNASQGAVCNNAHIWHDDIIQNINESADGVTHSNGFEFNIEDWNESNYVYNMVIRNNTCAVTVWVAPNHTDYYWNIVSYNNRSQSWDYDTTMGNPTSYMFNSTFADANGIGSTNNATNLHLQNVLRVNSSSANVTDTNGINMTDTQARTAGITSGSTYPYDLTSSNCNGQSSPTCPVGTGANLTSNWPSGFSTDDTTYACTYDTSNHSVSCPARTPASRQSSGSWDVGAYEFGTSTSSAPQPPTNLTVVVQ